MSGSRSASGTDIAIEAADLTLVGGDPRLVGSALAVSRATTRVIRENLFWAFAYNVVLIPVAMGVLYPAFGILLSPVFAAAAMALSSVSVVGNSLRLRRLDLDRGPDAARDRRQNGQKTGTRKTATANERARSGSPSFQ